MEEWGRQGAEMLVPGLLGEGGITRAAGTRASEGAESLGSAATQHVGEGEGGEPRTGFDHEEEPPTHFGEGAQATRDEDADGSANEWVLLRELTTELETHLGKLTSAASIDPIEAERLVRQLLRYLDSRKASLKRRCAHNCSQEWPDLGPGPATSRFCPWSDSMNQQIDEAEKVLRSHILAPATLKKYIALFNHWRMFLHNSEGPGASPFIVDGTDPVQEDRVIRFAGFNWVIGVRVSSLRSKLAAIDHFHDMNRLGRPLGRMTRLRKIMRAYAKMDGGSVHKLRLSREFLIKAIVRRSDLGTLLDLCLLSCYMMGWFGILRSQNYITSFLSPTEIDPLVTLLDEDVAFHYRGKKVEFAELTRQRLSSWKIEDLSVCLTFSGGKNGLAWERWIFATGRPELEPVKTIAFFAVARNEIGAPYEGKLPFHRVGSRIEDYVTYPQLNEGLKADGVSQGLNEEDIASHGLRGGGGCAMEQSCGGNVLKDFGNWLSDAYKCYRDASRLQGWTGFAEKMAGVDSTNAQAEAELHVKQNSRRILEQAREARTQGTGAMRIHGAEFEQELALKVGAIWEDEGKVWRLIAVNTNKLDTFVDGDLYIETHVVGIYVDHILYPNEDACPPCALEWSKAEEVLGWIRGAETLEGGPRGGDPVGPT